VTGSHDSDELRHIGDREALSIALHKPQVYVDLSGWSPKYFSPQLVHYAR
jgi:predicted TIM-barrel fold metal-dependent hydrolase